MHLYHYHKYYHILSFIIISFCLEDLFRARAICTATRSWCRLYCRFDMSPVRAHEHVTLWLLWGYLWLRTHNNNNNNNTACRVSGSPGWTFSSPCAIRAPRETCAPVPSWWLILYLLMLVCYCLCIVWIRLMWLLYLFCTELMIRCRAGCARESVVDTDTLTNEIVQLCGVHVDNAGQTTGNGKRSASLSRDQ